MTDLATRFSTGLNNRKFKTTHVIAMLSVGMVVLASIGCAPTRLTIRGKVMSGEVGIALAVPGNDARLTQPGLAGAKVSLARTAHAAVPLADTTTMDDGSFTFSLVPELIKAKMGLAVSLPGYVSLNTMATMPEGEQQLLIMLEPIHVGQNQ